MRANNIANPGCFEATQCWASKECGLYPRSHGRPQSRLALAPVSRYRTALGKPFSVPRIDLAGGRKRLPPSKDLKGGIWPRPRRGLCLGRSESSSCRTPVVGKGGVHGQEEPPKFLRDMQPDEDL
jgi:hypothetical protein